MKAPNIIYVYQDKIIDFPSLDHLAPEIHFYRQLFSILSSPPTKELK
jgi:hypothetical protein